MSECKWKDCEHHNFGTKRLHCQNCGIHIVDLIDNLYADNDQLRRQLAAEQAKSAELERKMQCRQRALDRYHVIGHKLRTKMIFQENDIESLLKRMHNIARTYEPSTELMEKALGDAKEIFASGGTIRRCIDCNTPVFGGPTRCSYCAGKITGREEVGVKVNVLRDALKEIILAHGNLPEKVANKEMAQIAQKAFFNITAGTELTGKTGELESTIAVMRSSLEEISQCEKNAYGNEFEVTERAMSNALDSIKEICDKALSNTANTEYADRVKKLEEALRLVLRRYHKLDSETAAMIKDALGEA